MFQRGKLILTEDILMGAFSSGWLLDKGTKKNARDYTYDLKRIFPFFINCTNIEEWIGRINELIYQYEHILPLFESDTETIESWRVFEVLLQKLLIYH